MFKLVDRAKAWKDGAGNTSAFVTHDPGHSAKRRQATVSDRSQPTQVRYNTEAPPSVAFAGGNLHLDRPLPAPPPGKVTMLERPSTSGGPGSKSQAGNDFSKFKKHDKRVSRDDFYLSMKPQAGTGFKQPQYATFHGQLPTPEGSPRSKASPRPTIPVVRVASPDSIEDRSAPIGMALGSPTHTPENWGAWSAQQTLKPAPVQGVHPASPLSLVESVDTYDVPREKKQPSRRKLFGLFGRRNTDQSQPSAVSISEPNRLGRTNQPDQATTKSIEEDQTRPLRSNTGTGQKIPKHKPIVIRSQTLPYEKAPTIKTKLSGFRSRNPSIDTLGNPNPHERSTSNFGSIPIVLEPLTETSTPTMPSLLNVDIPKSSLERYSVMFQDVLETHPSNSSALLARRQATIKELKKISHAVIVEEDERLVRPRRVTSPQPVARSPAFVLFPATPSGRNSSHQVSYPQPRVVRSNTSPALLPSPSRATFEVPLQPQPKNDSTAHHHVGRMAIPTAPKVTSVPQATPVHGFDFGPGKSSHVLESPSDMDYPTMSTEIITSTTVTHRIAEPDWQIIEPKTYTTPTSTSSSVASSRKRSPSSASSAQTHITKPSFDMSFEMDEPDYISTGRDPVEISIARQISISRQQRKMLQPLQTSFASARPRMGAAKGSPPVPRIAIGKNERLAETKTSTPTLVTRNETFETQLLQHRKSERIVFEDYD